MYMQIHTNTYTLICKIIQHSTCSKLTYSYINIQIHFSQLFDWTNPVAQDRHDLPPCFTEPDHNKLHFIEKLNEQRPSNACKQILPISYPSRIHATLAVTQQGLNTYIHTPSY